MPAEAIFQGIETVASEYQKDPVEDPLSLPTDPVFDIGECSNTYGRKKMDIQATAPKTVKTTIESIEQDYVIVGADMVDTEMNSVYEDAEIELNNRRYD